MTTNQLPMLKSSVGLVLLAAAACGGGPTIVFYDTALQPLRALEVRDARGDALEIDDGFALDDDDVLLVGRRLLAETCDYGTDPYVGLPSRDCATHAHGFIARVGRDGDVRWSLSAEGARDANCVFDVRVTPEGLHATADCTDGVNIGGEGNFDHILDTATGEVVGAPAPPTSTIYAFLAPLADGTQVGLFDETTTRGVLNENGVLVDQTWSRAAPADFSQPAGLQVIGDQVLVVGRRESTGLDLRFASLSLADGVLVSEVIDDGRDAWPSAQGWWSLSFRDEGPGHQLQHRDVTGAATAELAPDEFPYVLSGTHDELWAAYQHGFTDGTSPARVAIP